MKRLVTALLTVLVSLSVAAPVAFAATQPATPPSGSDFEARLKQRKTEREIKLEERDDKRIKLVCTKSQTTIRSLYQNAVKAIDDRNKAYYKADAKIWVMVGRLKLAEQDTFELEKQRANFAKQIADFQTTGSNFTQTLDDLLTINCAADAVGFKALLETARIYHKQIVAKSDAIREYAVNDLKTTLTNHATALQPKTEDTQ
jgi:hypothetical protein